MWPLAEPVVPVELYEITDRGRKLPDGAAQFNEFLRSYIARWAAQPAPPDLAHAA
jgi:hypothetical protein